MKKIIISSMALLAIGCGKKNISELVQEEKVSDSDVVSVHILPVKAYGVAFGKGMNSLVGPNDKYGKNFCMERAELSVGLVNPNAFDIKFELTAINNTVELMNKLNRNVSLTLGYKGALFASKMLSGSLSASSNLLEETKINANHSYILFTGEKSYKPLEMTSYNLRSDVVDYYTDRPSKFFEDCGDEFVSSVTVGTKVTALFECSSENSEEKSQIDTAINASIKAGGLTASMNYQEVINNVAKAAHGKCKLVVEATGGYGEISQDYSRFIPSVNDFLQKSPADQASPLEIGTTSYKVLRDKKFQDQILSKVDLDFNVQKNVIKQMDDNIRYLMDKNNRLESVLAVVDAGTKAEYLKDIQANVESIAKQSEFLYNCSLRPYEREACIFGTDSTDWGEWED